MPRRLHPIEASELHARRERVFLVLAGIFLGAMAMLNIVGITRFIQIGPLALAVGVLPYPLTFLCTDLIGELYGRDRARFVVTVGLLINALVLGTLWLGSTLPPVAPGTAPPWQTLEWKRLTGGRHLWLRNNGSTLVSQLVDSVLVIWITFGAAFVRGEQTLATMTALVGSSYAFKFGAALLDTGPFYLGVRVLSRYLQIDPNAEHDADAEELTLDA
jgi:uncharacterized PurR-regulated membrane protein YhhQ (DUF165 family)